MYCAKTVRARVMGLGAHIFHIENGVTNYFRPLANSGLSWCKGVFKECEMLTVHKSLFHALSFAHFMLLTILAR